MAKPPDNPAPPVREEYLKIFGYGPVIGAPDWVELAPRTAWDKAEEDELAEYMDEYGNRLLTHEELMDVVLGELEYELSRYFHSFSDWLVIGVSAIVLVPVFAAILSENLALGGWLGIFELWRDIINMAANGLLTTDLYVLLVQSMWVSLVFILASIILHILINLFTEPGSFWSAFGHGLVWGAGAAVFALGIGANPALVVLAAVIAVVVAFVLLFKRHKKDDDEEDEDEDEDEVSVAQPIWEWDYDPSAGSGFSGGGCTFLSIEYAYVVVQYMRY